MAKLWLALQNTSLSCLQRLKVATYLWKQEDVRKKKWPLLLKWTLDEVCRAHSKRARAHPPDQVRCQLWRLLSVMLESITTSASDTAVELWAGETSPSVHFFQVQLTILYQSHHYTSAFAECVRCTDWSS